MRRVPWFALILAGLVLYGLFAPPLSLQTAIANNAADMLNRIVMVADSPTGRTVTNLFTFDRDPSAPFAVSSGSAKVANLDADTVDGITSGRWSITYVTTTSTGTQNDFNPGINADGGPTIIRANNAATLTITGFPAGIDGQWILVQAINGVVEAAHQNTGSAATGRLVNTATSAATPAQNGGHFWYVYDNTTQRWRLGSHEQGGWITPTFAGGDYTASSGTWTVDSGDISVFRYRLSGRTLHVVWNISATTVSATPTSLQRIVPGSFTPSAAYIGTGAAIDNAQTREGSVWQISGSNILLGLLDASTWQASTNATSVFGSATFEVN